MTQRLFLCRKMEEILIHKYAIKDNSAVTKGKRYLTINNLLKIAFGWIRGLHISLRGNWNVSRSKTLESLTRDPPQRVNLEISFIKLGNVHLTDTVLLALSSGILISQNLLLYSSIRGQVKFLEKYSKTHFFYRFIFISQHSLLSARYTWFNFFKPSE